MKFTTSFLIRFALPVFIIAVAFGFIAGNIVYFLGGLLGVENIQQNYSFIVVVFSGMGATMALYATIKGYESFSKANKMVDGFDRK